MCDANRSLEIFEIFALMSLDKFAYLRPSRDLRYPRRTYDHSKEDRQSMLLHTLPVELAMPFFH